MKTILILSTQRNNFYIDITADKNINYLELWYIASKKRYMKLDGIIELKSIEEYENFINLHKVKSCNKFFNSYAELINFLEK